MVRRVSPPEANAALLSRYGDRPWLAASRDRVEKDIGLEEAFGGGCGTVVRDFHENCGGKAHLLPSRDDKLRFLNKLNGLPSGVARNSLVKPLVHDCRAVGVSAWAPKGI